MMVKDDRETETKNCSQESGYWVEMSIWTVDPDDDNAAKNQP